MTASQPPSCYPELDRFKARLLTAATESLMQHPERHPDEAADKAAGPTRIRIRVAAGPWPRRRRLLLLATVVSVATALVLTPVLGSHRQRSGRQANPGRGQVLGGSPAFAAERLTDGRIRLELDQAPWAGPGGLTRLEHRLRAAGVPYRIREFPVSPTMVHQMLLAEETNGAIDEGSAVLIDPTARPAQLVLEVGRAAKPGEHYESATDAFAPGERLAGLPCVAGAPMDSATLQRYATRLGLRVHWVLLPAQNGGIPTDPAPQRPEGLVNGAFMDDDHTVRVEVDGPGGYTWPLYYGHGWGGYKCDAATIARWR